MSNQFKVNETLSSSAWRRVLTSRVAPSLSVVVAALALSSGCSSTDGDGDGDGVGGAPAATGGSAPTFVEVTSFIETNCSMAGCHGETTPADPNVFTSYLPEMLPGPNLHTTLTTFLSDACGGVPVVSPGNSAGSAIMMLANGQCGDPTLPTLMPYECFEAPCLSADDAAMISGWIDAGAPAQ